MAARETECEKRRISKLLEMCGRTNVLGGQESEIRDLITDYFCCTQQEDNGWWEPESDSESDESPSESEFGGDEHDGDSGGGANVDDSEAIEEPIVRVIGGAECVPDDMANALQQP
jgi:hypothetical protein